MTDHPAARVYLDHAATGWPKPERVYEAMDRFARQTGAAAGRGAYRSATLADEVVASCRRRIARMVGVSDPARIAFFSNGTTALHAAIFGTVRDGDHVVTTAIEHNSVLRPLEWLRENRGVVVDVAPCDAAGRVDPADVLGLVKPQTRLVAISHASNVTGAVQDIAAVGRQLASGETLLLCDAAQTLGYLPIDVSTLGIDLLAAPGHKGGCGPLGTGMLAVSEKASAWLRPTLFGGTGSASESLDMPRKMPMMLEPGNLNVPAIAGWAAGLDELAKISPQRHAESQSAIATQLHQAVSSIAGVSVIGGDRLPIVSMTFDGADIGLVATLLDTEFGIEVRSGLHCAALIHRYLGTSPHGTLRASGGHGTTDDQIRRLGDAIAEIAAELGIG
jgi:cysteine desulfurase / selenocysteine lyase